MMTPMPLMKERLNSIKSATMAPQIPILQASQYVGMILDLLEAEAYWREACIALDPSKPGNAKGECHFCGSADHREDCSWRLAQD